MRRNDIVTSKFKFKKGVNIVYYGLLLIVTAFVIVHWISAFNQNIVVVNEEINSHISNFSISLLFYLVIGSTWLLQGISFNIISVVGILIIIANILCETIMGFMNTMDIMDAIYGIVGTMVSFFFLLILKKYGLIAMQDKEQS